jgi:hypothetical protein
MLRTLYISAVCSRKTFDLLTADFGSYVTNMLCIADYVLVFAWSSRGIALGLRFKRSYHVSTERLYNCHWTSMWLTAQGDKQTDSGRGEGGQREKIFRNPAITGKKIPVFGFVGSSPLSGSRDYYLFRHGWDVIRLLNFHWSSMCLTEHGD